MYCALIKQVLRSSFFNSNRKKRRIVMKDLRVMKVLGCVLFSLLILLPAAYSGDIPLKVEGVQVETGDGEISLSWEASEGAESYSIKCYKDGATLVNLITTEEFVVENLANGTEYTIELVAKNDFGDSDPVILYATPTPSGSDDDEGDDNEGDDGEGDDESDDGGSTDDGYEPSSPKAYVIIPNKINLEWTAFPEIVEGYVVYLDGEEYAQTTETSLQIEVDIQEDHLLEITSYLTGVDGTLVESDPVAIQFTGQQLPGVENLTAKLEDGAEKLVVEFSFEDTDQIQNLMIQLGENAPMDIGKKTKKVFYLPDSALYPPFNVTAWAVYTDDVESEKMVTETVLTGIISSMFVLCDNTSVAKVFFTANEGVIVQAETDDYTVTLESGDTILLDSETEVFSSLNGIKGESLSVTSSNDPTGRWLLNAGWHLLSNPTDGEVSLPEEASSVWKWSEGKWLVSLPGEEDGGEEYAEAKGFGIIEKINPKEGFWVNSSEAIQLSSSGNFSWKNPSVKEGWNLLGAGETTVTPYQFQDAKSVWKWSDGKWLVFLPSEEDGGEEYATTKGFGTIAQINPGEGFWVNQ